MEVSGGSEQEGDQFLLSSQLAPKFILLQRLATQLEPNSPEFCSLIKKFSTQYRYIAVVYNFC